MKQPPGHFVFQFNLTEKKNTPAQFEPKTALYCEAFLKNEMGKQLKNNIFV